MALLREEDDALLLLATNSDASKEERERREERVDEMRAFALWAQSRVDAFLVEWRWERDRLTMLTRQGFIDQKTGFVRAEIGESMLRLQRLRLHVGQFGIPSNLDGTDAPRITYGRNIDVDPDDDF